MKRSTLAVLAVVLVGLYKFLYRSKGELRIGHGFDIHTMREMQGSHKPLFLGGVKISDNHYVDAHSDGDAVLHAVTDAILGAAGFPDIGEIFSDKDERWRNKSSDFFLMHALDLLGNFRVRSVDVTVILERPKFAPFKPLVLGNLKRLLGTDAVNVKARTHEKVDAVGEGRAVACHAVVLLETL